MKHKHLMLFPKTLFTAVLALSLLLGVQTTTAGVSAEVAAQLKTTLTPLGAERAGNADGTIPAWEGGYTQVPEGYKNGDHRPDFFADEKPLYSITGQNMDQYKDKLNHGARYLLKKHPDFRMDVYPSHRTAAAPQWVYDNTFKNATRAKLAKGGLRVSDAYGGIPFPIPQNGDEVLWNARLYWRSEAFTEEPMHKIVTPDGKIVTATEGRYHLGFHYYNKGGSLETYEGYYFSGLSLTTAPPYKAGEMILLRDPSHASAKRGIWQYLVGQRRVRRAPSISYDTPDYATSGIGFYDEAYMITGPTDRHKLKLLGKKEMYIYYNSNGTAITKFDDLLTPNFLNPDHVRWELHRVWAVEATLKEGKRHVVARRIYYMDEDTWQIVMIDGWDGKGDFWRMVYALPLLCPDIPCVTGYNQWGTYEFRTGSYSHYATNESETQLKIEPPFRKGFFTPNTMLRRAR